MIAKFNIKNYLIENAFTALNENIYNKERAQLATDFLHRYSFLDKDEIYVDFMKEINGLMIGNLKFITIVYGFALSQPEVIYPIEKYLLVNEYLWIGEYVDKTNGSRWDSIIFAYKKADKKSIVDAKFNIKNHVKKFEDTFYPLCEGFEKFIKIVLNKNLKEQFYIATGNKF